jgi:hypothetical protein
MKPILSLTVAALSFSVATAALADSVPPNSQASQLGVQTVSTHGTTRTSAEQLNRMAHQVNQDVSDERHQGQANALPPLRDLLHLPKDMIIRGSKSSGLVVGAQF